MVGWSPPLYLARVSEGQRTVLAVNYMQGLNGRCVYAGTLVVAISWRCVFHREGWSSEGEGGGQYTYVYTTIYTVTSTYCHGIYILPWYIHVHVHT